MVTGQYIKIGEHKVFYRKAGERNKPTILLLHGFPSSSHMFRDLMPLLEDDYFVIAPDFPGFGNTISPCRRDFNFTFENITQILLSFIEDLDLSVFYMYVFDYGAPIGFRIAINCPEKIKAIISQNGNIYEDGLGEKWSKRKLYWAAPSPELREEYKNAFAPDTIINQYTYGTIPGSVIPDGYNLDIFYTNNVEYIDIQSDLIFDYQSNVKLYPEFQRYLREYQPPLLAIWGKNDPSFIPAGAQSFKKDLKNCVIQFVDSGHFALETHSRKIATKIHLFLSNL